MVRQDGRTLVEMVAVLAIVAILAQQATAGWGPALAHHQARVSTAALLDAIRLARASSVSLRHPVTLCPGAVAAHCLSDWTRGLLVFVDENGNGQVDGQDRVLRHLQPAGARSRIEWRAFRNKRWLQFRPDGHTAHQNGSFVYCPGNGDTRVARVVIVNKLGHARLGRDGNGDGVVEMASGRPVRC